MWHKIKIQIKKTWIKFNYDLKRVLGSGKTKVSYGIVAGEGLEAEGVVLLADEDLVGDGQRPLEAPDFDVKNCIKIS